MSKWTQAFLTPKQGHIATECRPLLVTSILATGALPPAGSRVTETASVDAGMLEEAPGRKGRQPRTDSAAATANQSSPHLVPAVGLSWVLPKRHAEAGLFGSASFFTWPAVSIEMEVSIVRKFMEDKMDRTLQTAGA